MNWFEDLLKSSRGLTLWIEGGKPGQLPSAMFEEVKNLPNDSIFDTKPSCWLYAVPDEYVRLGERDSHVRPSFVIF